MARTLAELQVKKPADKLRDVKGLALVDVLAYILAGKIGKDTCCESRRDVEVYASAKTLAYRVADVKTKKVRTH